jgi:hypothetical protein
MLISITADDIYAGRRNDCLTCPTALAILRATGFHAYVEYESITITIDNWTYIYDVPEVVQDFAVAFDASAHVLNNEPIEFELPFEIIRITEDVIFDAVKRGCCPVTLALRKRYRDAYITDTVYFTETGGGELPEIVTDWLDRYNDDLPVGRLTFLA